MRLHLGFVRAACCAALASAALLASASLARAADPKPTTLPPAGPLTMPATPPPPAAPVIVPGPNGVNGIILPAPGSTDGYVPFPHNQPPHPTFRFTRCTDRKYR
jgi:hypothetical protein